MYNPFLPDITQMTDVEFEKYVENIVKIISSKEGIDCSIEHNKIIEVDDGSYQIDIIAKHNFLGTENITLIECKKYKDPVKRERVELLYSRIRSIGAHKGILFSTARFQKGAITYAKKHGIALVQVIKGELIYETRSAYNEKIEIPEWVVLPDFCGEHIYEIESGFGITLFDEEHNESLINFIIG